MQVPCLSVETRLTPKDLSLSLWEVLFALLFAFFFMIIASYLVGRKKCGK